MNSRIVVLIGIIVFNTTAYSQTRIINQPDSLVKFFNVLSDTISFLSRQPNAPMRPDIFVIFNIDSLNEFKFHIRDYSTIVTLKINQKNYESIFLIVDSLAKTPVFTNKVLANEIYHRLLSYFYNKRFLTSEELEIAKKIIYSDIDNCMRYVCTNNILSIKKNMITDDLIKKIRDLLINYKRTKEEAIIYLNSKYKYFSILDTNGYYNEKIQVEKGETRNAEHFEKVYYWIKEANKRNQDLKVYLDSLQELMNSRIINSFMDIPISYIRPIVVSVGNNYIKELSPEIEKIYESDSTFFIAGLVLARLQYRDYEIKMIKKIQSKYDNLVQSEGTLFDFSSLFDQLCYINTKNSFSLMSNFITLNFKSYDDIYKIEYSYGDYFLSILNSKILNLPWEYNYKNLMELNKNKGEWDEKIVINHIWLTTNPISENDRIKITSWLKNNTNDFIISENTDCEY